MKALCGFVLGIGLAAIPLTSRAAIDCTGLVHYALFYADGTVNVLGEWRGGYTYLCNTNGTWGGVPPEVCLSWYATAVKAAADGKELALYYGTDAYTCATLPTYSSSLVPTYVGLKQ